MRNLLSKFGYVYIMWTLAHPFAFKVGISRNPKARRAQIEAELRNKSFINARVHLLLYVPSLFRERHEARLHEWLKPFRAKIVQHAGHTEWFYSFAPNLALGALLYIMSPDGFSYSKFVLFALFAFAPFPVGAIVALLLLSIIEVTLIVTTIVAFITIATITINAL